MSTANKNTSYIMFVIAFRLHLKFGDCNNDFVSFFFQFSEPISNSVIHLDTSLFKVNNILTIGVGK